MRRFIFIMFVMILLSCFSILKADNSKSGFLIAMGCRSFRQEKEEFRETYNVEVGTEVIILNRNGPITVGVWDKNYIEVYAIKMSSYGKDELAKVTIEVGAHEDINFIIETKFLDREAKVSVGYDIKVPENVVVNNIKTSNGKVMVTEVRGDTRVFTSNSSIEVEGVDGFVNAINTDGNIKIKRSTGILNAETNNGDIEVDILNVLENEDLEIKTGNGSIKIFLKDDLNADISMKTQKGTVSVHDLQLLIKKQDKGSVNCEVGTGGSDLKIETLNGNIDVYQLVD